MASVVKVFQNFKSFVHIVMGNIFVIFSVTLLPYLRNELLFCMWPQKLLAEVLILHSQQNWISWESLVRYVWGSLLSFLSHSPYLSTADFKITASCTVSVLRAAL